MKPGLKRIEATLGQLSDQPLPPTEPLIMAQIAQEMAQEMAQDWVNIPTAKPKALQSFPLPPDSLQPASQPPESAQSFHRPASPPQLEQISPQILPQKPAKPAGSSRGKKAAGAPTRTDTLPQPKAKPPSFSSHRHALNPNLAVGLLKEVESVVISWQLQLEQTVLEIQALYLEGPIVDGWLESHPVDSPQVMQSVGAATLRHAEIERLMDYVEEICRTAQTPEARTGYRLCGLDADGQLWSRPCPSQQVPYVGMAVARYQKLRILLARKQTLETRLHRLIQNLTLLHSQMQE
jgi:hypothetical protein